MIGRRLAHFEITALLGQGGMGEVYRARDTRLGREVALKVLPASMAQDPERLERFEREAKTIAALSHPNIVTIFSVEEANGVSFLTMELVDGQNLGDFFRSGGLDLERLLPLSMQIADALAAAHEKGITHRDIKPGNVMVTLDGRVKVLDFGLAKQAMAEPEEEAQTELMTQAGAVLGTVPYMSPEQVQGRPVDQRSDVFSFGILLCEMATGRRPFRGDDAASVMASILKDEPDFDGRIGIEVPQVLLDLIKSCLEKEPSLRPTAAEMRDALRAQQEIRTEAPGLLRRPLVRVAAVVLVLLLVVFGSRLVRRNRALAFQAEALPRIAEMARLGQFVEAFDLAGRVEEAAGIGTISQELWDKVSQTVSVDSEPPGARITITPLGTDSLPLSLGETPLIDVRVPQGPMHWKAEIDGYRPADYLSIVAPESFVLLPEGDQDADMVRVPGADVSLWILGGLKAPGSVPLGPFLIDRREVSNRDYAAFVKAGGYEHPRYWLHPFHDGERTLDFSEAMDRFRDATGRPGPASWRLGSYLDGRADLPVSGVSWYEAAAYAEFAGKELPTIYHWYYADTAGDIQLLPGLFLPESNFGSNGPRMAEGSGVLGAFGAVDMAGNLREWSATTTGADPLTLGGAWSDPSYVYMVPEQRPPLDRAIENGFRCIRRLEGAEPSPLELEPIERSVARDYRLERPVSDELYATLVRFYDKEPVPLEPRIELTDESAEHWIKQKVSYAAGYGDERMVAWLYLPRNTAPPYQTIVQMGGAATFYRRSSASEASIFSWQFAENLLRGGRAVLLPIWKGSYERSDGFHPFESSAAVYREHTIQWVSELRRSVDYLASREDIDAERIGYQGSSFGAMYSPLFMALEPRLSTGLVLVGGLLVMELGPGRFPPEIDALNFAPRVRAPVLMLNGRHDPLFPYETSQVPLYEMLGTPEEDKRHVTFPAGHSTASWRNDLVRESLAWLDRYFGEPRRH